MLSAIPLQYPTQPKYTNPTLGIGKPDLGLTETELSNPTGPPPTTRGGTSCSHNGLSVVWPLDNTYLGRLPHTITIIHHSHATVNNNGTVISLTDTRDGNLPPVEGPAYDGFREFDDGIDPPNLLQTATPGNINGSIAPQSQPKKRKDKRTAASIQLATLNMKGRGSLTPNSANDKWNLINQLMRENRIAVLAVQETHLLRPHVDELNKLYGKRLHILHSEPPDRASNSRGVAFVINKERLEYSNTSILNIIPGRAALLSIKWHKVVKLNILNVYAPNSPSDNEKFWNELKKHWIDNVSATKPDIMLGDFNIVTDPRDRFPSHEDPPDPVNALADLCMHLNLTDAWREKFPDQRMFTYHHTGHQRSSRLDRIYMSPKVAGSTVNWANKSPGNISTDHKLVSVQITDAKLPFIGTSRWTIPKSVLLDYQYLGFVKALGQKLISSIPGIEERTDTNNVQTLYESFKTQILQEARQYAKKNVPKLNRRIARLSEERDRILNKDNESLDVNASLEASILDEHIGILEAKRSNRARTTIAVNDWMKGETLCTYWTKSAKPGSPREIIMSLRDPSGPTGPNAVYIRRSDNMAEAARTYHESLQADGIDNCSPIERRRQIREVLSFSKSGLDDDAKRSMDNPPDEADVLEALNLSANGKAPGLDGIPYELWKDLHRQYTESTTSPRRHRTTFNIALLFSSLFQDIHMHGLIPGSRFSEGWIVPLYKKNDRREIANYRPITLLNTDYKLFTKILSLKLSKQIHTLVHRDQAGFIPRRSIFDHTNLARAMIDYAEVSEENGLILALDQEKAYDRIRHDYLWETLRSFNLPESFINTLRSLYESAHSQLMINGVLSSPFQVSRGVRQGDPLSCLLFDLAIEPLACMLRRSDLTGYCVPGATERLICTLFADDTTVYLSHTDDYNELQHILCIWCEASGAKFNISKTEVLPIGSPTYRNYVLAHRRTNPTSPPIPDHIHIVEDGSPIRLLGGWIGNCIDNHAIWLPLVQRISSTLELWNRRQLSPRGKKLVIDMVVGGSMQYLAKVQGAPNSICCNLQRLVTRFMWPNHHSPPINMETLFRPKKEGGLGLLDVQSRIKAINLTWLKPLLDFSPNRPTWAHATDAILSHFTANSNTVKDRQVMILYFLQNWTVKGNSSSSLPAWIKSILNDAKLYRVAFRPIKLTPDLKRKLPIWFHLGLPPGTLGGPNSKASKCLRRNHKVRTVSDIEAIAEYGRLTLSHSTKHFPRRPCCEPCTFIRTTHDCAFPYDCFTLAHSLYNQLSAKWHPAHEGPSDGLSLTKKQIKRNWKRKGTQRTFTFDPSVSTGDDLSNCFRLLTDPNHIPADTAEWPISRRIHRPTVTFYTDGSCLANGSTEAAAGAGVWVAPNHPWNASVRVQGDSQSNQAGELTAILTALRTAPRTTPVRIVSDSRYCIEGIVLHSTHWEAKGWVDTDNKDLFQNIISWCRARAAKTSFKWVKGHSRNIGNEAADVLAAAGALLPRTDPPPSYSLRKIPTYRNPGHGTIPRLAL
jgi:ribonuclease HI/exonuclease III